jgi:hypothetical protein
MSRFEQNVVVGGGISGLITAHILVDQGYDVLLLERSDSLGGLTTSFQDSLGNWFDYGYHALDFNRSPFTTLFFQKILDNKCHIHELKRSLLLRDSVFPYNSKLEDWPESLKSLFTNGTSEENLTSPVTRFSLELSYGKPFIDFIFSEVIGSYSNLQWKKQQGLPDDSLLENIYPWFFPKSSKPLQRTGESQQYHDLVRSGAVKQQILYPKQGGFGQFLKKLIEKTEGPQLRVEKGIRDLRLEVDKLTKSINTIRYNGKVVSPARVFWCASPLSLKDSFDFLVPKMVPQRLLLGSFVFSKEVETPCHEILSATLSLKANRISFTGRLDAGENNRVQVEYFDVSALGSSDGDTWRKHWLEGFLRAGIIDSSAEVLGYDFKQMPRGMVCETGFEEIINDCQRAVLCDDSNLTVPFWGVGPENINRLVPAVFKTVYACLFR